MSLKLGQRAIIHILVISLITNPAMAEGFGGLWNKGTELLGRYASRLKGNKTTPEALAQAEKVVATKADAQALKHEADVLKLRELKVADQTPDLINEKTGGLYTDVGLVVQKDEFGATVGRDDQIVLLQAKVASHQVIALVGAQGSGKSQYVLGLQAVLNEQGKKNMKIVSVDTSNSYVDDVKSFESHTAKLAELLEPQVNTVVVHFASVKKFLASEKEAGQNANQKLDQLIQAARRALSEKGKKLVVVIEGGDDVVKQIAKHNPTLARSLAKQTVKELTEVDLLKIVTNYANKLFDEVGFTASPEVVKKAFEFARNYYGELGMPLAAKVLLREAMMFKGQRIANKNKVDFLAALRVEKETLLKEEGEARKIVDAVRAGQRTGGAEAFTRLAEIRNELATIDAHVERLTAKFTRFAELIKEQEKISRQLADSTSDKLTSELRQKLAKIDQELHTLDIEDVALHMHVDGVATLDETLKEFKAYSLADQIKKYSELIFGQPHIVKVIAAFGQNLRSTRRVPGKPAGIIWLLGQRGTGKTETARATALVETGSVENMIRLDGEDYMLEQAQSRLKGPAPGLVGFDSDTDIASQLVKKPKSVLLIDEADKILKKIFNTQFLSMFTTARVENTAGKVGKLDETIVIITSNDGADLPANADRAQIVEYLKKPKIDESSGEVVSGYAAPVLDRVDEFLVTNPVGQSSWGKVFLKNINEINKKVLRQTLNSFRVTDNAQEALMKEVAKEGAESGRAVGRVVERLRQQVMSVFDNGRYYDAFGNAITLEVAPGDKILVDIRVVSRFNKDQGRYEEVEDYVIRVVEVSRQLLQ